MLRLSGCSERCDLGWLDDVAICVCLELIESVDVLDALKGSNLTKDFSWVQVEELHSLRVLDDGNKNLLENLCHVVAVRWEGSIVHFKVVVTNKSGLVRFDEAVVGLHVGKVANRSNVGLSVHTFAEIGQHFLAKRCETTVPNQTTDHLKTSDGSVEHIARLLSTAATFRKLAKRGLVYSGN